MAIEARSATMQFAKPATIAFAIDLPISASVKHSESLHDALARKRRENDAPPGHTEARSPIHQPQSKARASEQSAKISAQFSQVSSTTVFG